MWCVFNSLVLAVGLLSGCDVVLLPSSAVPGDVLSGCGVGIPVLVRYAVRLFSRCSLLDHLYLWFEGLLPNSASLVAQRVKRLPAVRETQVHPWVGKIPWRRKWQPTPVLLPGKFHGRRSLVGYSPWGCKESDTTERLHFPFT